MAGLLATKSVRFDVPSSRDSASEAPSTPEDLTEITPTRTASQSLTDSQDTPASEGARPPLHHMEGERLRARLRRIDAVSANDEASQRTRPSPSARPSQRPALTGTKRGFMDGFHLRRGTYLARYTDGTGIGRGAVPLGPAGEKNGTTYLGAEQTAGTPGGFISDSIFSMILAPLAAGFSWHAAKQALEGLRACKALKNREATLAMRIDAATRRMQAASPQAAPLFAAEHKVLLKKSRETTSALKLRRNNVAEAISSSADRGAVFGGLVASMVAKAAALASGKGLGALVSTAGSAGVSSLGMVASFVFAPIAGVFQLTESAYQLRRASHMKKSFDEAAPHARDYVRERSLSPGLEGYAAFFDRKFGLRERFYKRFRNFARFRVAAASLLGASAAVKLGISITALAVTGFALSSPVGWVLTGLVLGAALIGTVGAAIFFFDRRRSSYDRYTYQDDALIDRDFIQNLDALDSLATQPHAHASGSRDSSRAVSQTPRVPQSHARAGLLANDWAAANAASLAANTGFAVDAGGGARSGDDEDDDEDTATSPAAVMPQGLGIHYRAKTFRTLDHQHAAWRTLQGHMNTHYNTRDRARPIRALAGFRGLLQAAAHACFRLLGSGAISGARASYAATRMKHAASLTHRHYRQFIAQGNPGWRDFMVSHLRAEKVLLEHKQTLRQGFTDAPSDHPLMRKLTDDTERLAKINAFLQQLEQPAANQVFEIENAVRPTENRAFLSLIQQNARSRTRSDEDVTQVLARAIARHYRRRNRDLKGILFETELDAARIRASGF